MVHCGKMHLLSFFFISGNSTFADNSRENPHPHPITHNRKKQIGLCRNLRKRKERKKVKSRVVVEQSRERERRKKRNKCAIDTLPIERIITTRSKSRDGRNELERPLKLLEKGGHLGDKKQQRTSTETPRVNKSACQVACRNPFL